MSFIVYPLVTNATGARLIEVPTLNDGYDLERHSRGRQREYARRVPGESEQSHGNAGRRCGRSIASSIACRRTSSPFLTKPITILRTTSPPSAASTTRTRWTTFAQGRPVVVLRTFSKAQGLAGLRVGYGMGPAELMALLRAHASGVHGFVAG